MKEIFENYVKKGLEGIILKNPEAVYQPGKRGFDWIKYKKSSKGYVVDTIDAVVMGYYSGRGVRSKFGIGAILIVIYNEKRDKFETIAKVGTGIKDDDFIKIKKRLDELQTEQMPEDYDVVKLLKPDKWVLPEIVCTVEADEITKSKNHTAGAENGVGFSLRFPRLIEFERIDKKGKETNSVEEIKNMINK